MNISECKKICKQYNIKPHHIANYRVNNPGKFEGESLACEYFYNGILEGWGDDSDCIALDSFDKLVFGIDESKAYAQITIDSNGFVYLAYLTEDEYCIESFNPEVYEDFEGEFEDEN